MNILSTRGRGTGLLRTMELNHSDIDMLTEYFGEYADAVTNYLLRNAETVIIEEVTDYGSGWDGHKITLCGEELKGNGYQPLDNDLLIKILK